MEPQRLTYLLKRHADNTLSAHEKAELKTLLQELPDESLVDQLSAALQHEQLPEYAKPVPETLFKRNIEAILSVDKPQTSPAPVHRIHFLRTAWFKYAAAVIIIFGIGAYLWNIQTKEKPSVTQSSPNPVKNDIQPGTNKAVLSLADGSDIVLDDARSGVLTRQNDVQLIKSNDGSLTYSGKGNEVVYNTLTVPRGAKMATVVLADGSKVWLNSESSLRYPIAFVGNERKVELTGEAYFEVAKNESKKFLVTSGGVTTEVLGTHFNVNAYADEQAVQVTLLEGAVKVSKGNDAQLLKPDQQAAVTDRIMINQTVDLETVMAWKNGLFQFPEASIETIMQQVARYYNAEVVYEGKINGNFVVEISRDVPVSKLLNILELTNKVHFNIEGNRITVRP